MFGCALRPRQGGLRHEPKSIVKSRRGARHWKKRLALRSDYTQARSAVAICHRDSVILETVFPLVGNRSSSALRAHILEQPYGQNKDTLTSKPGRKALANTKKAFPSTPPRSSCARAQLERGFWVVLG